MTSHLKALLKKNWILAKRSWCCTILEIIFPTIFIFNFIAFRAASPIEELDKTSFYAQPYKFLDSYTTINDMLIKNCWADENGGRVVLSPPTDSIIIQLDNILRSNFM